MKELSIEQKAKRYDEAIKVAKSSLTYPDFPGFIRADVVFPELKESEDEKIKKALFNYVKTEAFGFNTFCGIPTDDVLAWIEKQGEQPQGKSALEAAKEEKVDNANKIEPKDYSSIDPHFFKSADNVEPKFEVGDWITNGFGNPMQISSIDDDMYNINNDTVSGYIDSTDKEYHLWTIQDAKDGDVLISRNNNPFIYNGERDYFTIGAYCGLVGDTFSNSLGTGPWTENLDIHPATKEQRDILFKAMADDGYTFDFEKKELKKIE